MLNSSEYKIAKDQIHSLFQKIDFERVEGSPSKDTTMDKSVENENDSKIDMRSESISLQPDILQTPLAGFAMHPWVCGLDLSLPVSIIFIFPCKYFSAAGGVTFVGDIITE